MSLGQPGWLLLALLLGVLVYFHRQRRAARAAEVGSVHLWRRVALSTSPQARPRVRVSAALLLQGAAVLLVALALARPTPTSPVGAGQVVLLIEAGRAMRAADVRPDRFGVAARRAVRDVRGRSTVLLVADVPRPLAVNRADAAGVRAALEGAAAGDGAPDWMAAARQLRALDVPTGTPVIVYASPGEVARARQALAALTPDVRAVGQSAPNAAVSALSVTPAADGAPWTLRGRVRQFGPAGMRTVTVALDGAALAERRLVLAPGGETDFSVRFTPGTGGVLSATLDASDVLPADDSAQVVLRPTPRPLRVSVVGPAPADGADDPVGRVLAALPGAVVTRIPALPAAGAADLLVVTGTAEVRPGLAPVSVWLPAASAAGTPDSVLGWAAGDPLGSGIAWSDVGRVARVALPAWADAAPLVTGAGGPLIEVARGAGHTAVRVALSTAAGGWTESPAFPVLFARLGALARPDAGARVVPPCRVGLPCALPAGLPDVRFPDGTTQRAAGETFVPWRAGVYRVDGQALAVNRLAGADADLRAAAPDAVTPAPPPADWRAALTTLWRPLLAVALLAVLVELAVLFRSEPALRRRRWRAVTAPQRRMLALHALSAALLLLAVLDVQVPAPAAPARALTVAAADGPDLATALEVAAARVPAGTRTTLRVPGQPWPMSARVPDVLARLRSQDVGVQVGVPTAPSTLTVTAFDTPGAVQPGQAFTAQVVLESPVAGRVRLRLRRGDTVLLDGPVDVKAGLNRLALPLREPAPGVAGYTLSVQPSGQAAVQAVSATRVGEPQPVLVVGTAGPGRTALMRALAVQGLTARAVAPADLRAADLQASARTVLLDTPAAAIPPPLRAALADCVRAGGHVLIAGSGGAFGPGGYIGTTLEGLSPLSGRVPRDLPRLALALVLDKSGSMNEGVGGGITKLDLIKSAALNSALLLSPQSDVTVIAFDSSPKVAVPLTRATNVAVIRAQISRIEAEGGTVVKRALDASLKELLKSGASRKHLILLTDGVDGGIFSPDEYRRLIRRMRATGITVSTVSVGSGMHVPLMRDMATWGEGHFAQAQDWRDVPSLMARDTLALGDSAVKTGPHAAQWPAGPAFTVTQYTRTTLKPGATPLGVIGRGADADPLAATWRVGLGSVTALALSPTDARSGVGTRPDFPALVAPLVRGTPLPGAGADVTLRRDGADLLVSAPTAQVTVDGPDGPWPVTLQPGADGTFTTRLYAPPPGGYSAPGAAAGVPTVTRDPAALALGGRAAGPDGGAAWTWRAAWPALSVLALLVFLGGLALRYLPERGPRPGAETVPSMPS
ncbi:hypothetical protein HNQ07_000371 [Deinococcus metalli]|uniref:VWFA domain-containing protein n=1 Tax=Deinococcus metalli TaxID=1141878 RepID=A0A7W8KAY7_9DEIO|nr:VWA domain-containing protein [Deinococcus metalli]MBB5374927.1 hypothetical protein [Deinococcus metalli]GHF32656.1 hypothetical protein GCM10017781_06700 [Deinococcus metalli]